ncbi:MAG: glycosyltransferase [Planctomycetaceae bacterium]
MKIGRALADAALAVPGIAPLIPRVQTGLRAARSRRRARRIAAALADAGSSAGAAPPEALPVATPAEYAVWIAHQESPREAIHRRDVPPPPPPHASSTPLVSLLIPVYRVKTAFLRRTLESLRRQSFGDWEACLACADPDDAENRAVLLAAAGDDPRIRVEFLPRNGGISATSNAALEMARGTFVGLLDHDDELAPFALARMAEAIATHADADFLYSDKDSIDEDSTLRQHALFKPQWSPEILWSVNYLTHFNLLRRSLVNEVGGFRSETDGAQDWDIFLRVCERARGIVRVPGVQYHWRIHAASTSTGIAAKPYALDGQLRSLEDRVARERLPARVEPSADSGFQLKWRIPTGLGIHVVIDGTAGGAETLPDLAAKVAGDAAAGPPRRVSVVAEAATAATLAGMEGVEVVCGTAADLPRLANDLVARSLGETAVVVFLSGRVADLSSGWLAELAGWAGCHPAIGFASALVLDSAGDVVEAGLVVDRHGAGSPMFRGSPLRKWGWFGGPLWYRNCSAASPWAVAVQADAWVAAGGFDTRLDWQASFVKLCTAIRREGRRGMVDPHARITLQPGELPAVPTFDESLRADPHFHPAFSAVVPLSLDAACLPAAAPPAAPARRRWTLPRVGRLRRRRDLLPAAVRPAAGSYATDALALARINGCTRADLAEPQQHPERVGRGPGAGWCNWFLPTFDHPYYGGVMTILRCADYLTRSRGLRQRFLICGPCDGEALLGRIAAVFPGLGTARVVPLDCAEAITAIPAADYSFATLWTTAYVLHKVRNTGLKFYFIQDWEPLFYPAGSTSAQAELTYDFGFYGIANTRPLRRFYENEHGGTAVHFTPQIDPAVFHGHPLRAAGGPKRLFFYGRPGHPRNGFELAAVALTELKARLGDRVQILCAGAPWDAGDYGLGGVIENLGLLDYRATADLYRSCHVGFVMMMTRHPSYLPFEFMACGGLLVSNDNPANRWLLRDGENCLLSPPSAPAIAERLTEAVERFDDLLAVRRRGWEQIRIHHASWDHAFADVWAFIAERAAHDAPAPLRGAA